MKTLNTLKGNNLIWKQPKFGIDHFELRLNDDLFAELYWTEWLSDRAVGKCAGLWWSFDRLGFFRDKIVATIGGSETTVATFEVGCFFEGEIQLADGRVFQWYRTKTFANAWALTQADGSAVFTLEHGMHWLKQEAWIRLYVAADYPELPLLFCMALYLICCANQDAAAATGAIGAIAACT